MSWKGGKEGSLFAVPGGPPFVRVFPPLLKKRKENPPVLQLFPRHVQREAPPFPPQKLFTPFSLRVCFFFLPGNGVRRRFLFFFPFFSIIITFCCVLYIPPRRDPFPGVDDTQPFFKEGREITLLPLIFSSVDGLFSTGPFPSMLEGRRMLRNVTYEGKRVFPFPKPGPRWPLFSCVK